MEGHAMPDRKPPPDELGTEPGLSGGPGPTPPGFGDGTPRLLPDGSPGVPPPDGLGDEVDDGEETPVRGGDGQARTPSP
jgi:hypothetical protein